MVQSPLTSQVLRPAQKWSSRRGVPVSQAVAHHWAGMEGGIERLVYSKDLVSTNYIILSDGTLISSVPEEYRAWTSGSATADRKSITTEIQNSTLGPEWRVSDDAIDTYIKLLADVAKRYHWSSISRTNLKGHREFQSTACPGPYVWPLLPTIAKEANALFLSSTPSKPSTPSTPSTTVKAWPAVELRVDGAFGTLSVTAYQLLLKGIGEYAGYIDGVFGMTTVKAEQRWLAELGYYRGRIDGQRGPLTISALQSFLKSKKLYTGRIDGSFGPMTAKALQLYLNSQRRYF